jgi:hypothetical protein
MTHIQSNSHKNTAFKLSEQVKAILHAKGYSFLFNYSDYAVYKKAAKKNFNKALDIAEYFIFESQENSDFNDFIF